MPWFSRKSTENDYYSNKGKAHNFVMTRCCYMCKANGAYCGAAARRLMYDVESCPCSRSMQLGKHQEWEYHVIPLLAHRITKSHPNGVIMLMEERLVEMSYHWWWRIWNYRLYSEWLQSWREFESLLTSSWNFKRARLERNKHGRWMGTFKSINNDSVRCLLVYWSL